MKNLKRGFTLIELIVVMAIGIILVGVGALSLMGARSSQTIQIETQELAAILQSAQEKAIGQDTGGGTIGSRWGVYFDTSGSRHVYYLYQVNETLRAQPDSGIPPGDIIDTHTVKSPVTLSLADPDDPTIIFSKATGRPEFATTITVSGNDPALTKHVTVSLQGKIDYE